MAASCASLAPRARSRQGGFLPVEAADDKAKCAVGQWRDIVARDLPWDDAVHEVLRSAEGALHYTEIAERIAQQRLRKQVGATPAATVAAILSKSLSTDGSPYQKVGRGVFALKDKLQQEGAPQATPAPEEVAESETGALRAFGMFWDRGKVMWTGKPRLLGRQGLGASEVNFAEQVGVYLLHDRERVIYVGRASDTLFARLKAHTTDRLGGRWDRFSWFGLRSVAPDGTLAEPSVAWTHLVVIETLEALLIESLEPPLNRKRGDNFSGVEYLQNDDPEIEGNRKKQLLAELMKSAGLST